MNPLNNQHPEKVNQDLMHSGLPAGFLIVAIGASAGGVAALKKFFEAVRPDSGCAYVVILHLSPDYESKLAEILQTVSPIPVAQIQAESVLVAPDHVYVIPPNKSLRISDGRLTLSDVISYEERRAPVDIFFRTLAVSNEGRCVAVILSGTGPNGSMGVKHIKERGGIIVVQDPAEAEFDDMPLASISTGLVDFVLPVSEIPVQILQYRDHLKIPAAPKNDSGDDDQTREELDEVAMREIFTQLRVRTGHEFSAYKRATMLRRISRRMNVRDVDTLTGYAGLLKNTAEEPHILLKDLLISVTNFFRDARAYALLEEQIIPRILHGKTGIDAIRIWVAGCATGEEAYSLAMLFAERTEVMADPPAVQIFATDIDEDALAHARSALYSNSDIADVSPERLRKFFIQEGRMYRVRRELREIVLFARHNVLKDPPFSRLALATCRNLLIYLNRAAQARVLQTIHFALDPGGFLLLGSSETVDGTGDLYVAVEREQSLYQSRAVVARPVPPLPEITPITRIASESPEAAYEGNSRAIERLSLTALHYQLLEHFAPPSVLVNADYEIVHLSERAGQYMHIAGGEPSYNLLNVVRPELRLELRGALYSAAQSGEIVRTIPIPAQIGSATEHVVAVVRPVTGPSDTARGFLLVMFEKDETSVLPAVQLSGGSDGLARRIEEDLIRTRAQLRSTTERYEIQTEEMRASNEELQAINEELRSAAEELETSKEELQSVNEELITVNLELKIKIDELSQSNNDFRNLMAATNIGTLFLDRGFHVKLFTPAAQDIFNLIPADYGRPLSDITHRLIETNLMQEAEGVMMDLQPVEREVHTADRQTYLMRISAYRTSEDRIAGVVVTFVSITAQKQALARLQESEARFRAIVSQSTAGIASADKNGRLIFSNRTLSDMLGYPEGGLAGRQLGELTHEEQAGDNRNLYEQTKQAAVPFQIERRLLRQDGTAIWANVSVAPILSDSGRLESIVAVAVDVTGRKETEEALRQSEERLRVTLESATDYAIINTDVDGIIQGWSTGAVNIFGYGDAEAIGQPAHIIFTPEDVAGGRPEMEMMTARDNGRALDERWHVRRDGKRIFMSGVMAPIRNPDLTGYVKVARDMTEQRLAEESLRISEERYRISLQSAEMGAWDWNIGTDEMAWNEQQFTMLGLSPSENLVTSSYLLKFIHPEDVAYVTESLQTAVNGAGVYQAEFRIVTAGAGDIRWMNGYGRAIAWADDRATRLAGVMYDITDQKALQDQKDQFIGIASHELKTPVTSIKAYAEVLRDAFSEAGDEHSAGLMQKLDGQVDRLTGLINALLDVTRIKEGKLELTRTSFDLRSLILEVVEEIGRTAQHRIMVNVPDVGVIFADRDRISQVITNLLSNAIKYSPGAEQIIVSGAQSDDALTVQVQDFGIGISDVVRDRVFERFYRSEEDSLKTYPGLGLGLYIASEIIRSHGGRIWVSSVQGAGAIFSFTLPLARS